MVVLCLGAGLLFSIRTRFMQVRGFAEMIRLLFRGHSSAAGISSFQALMVSLAGRIGVGNIAGIATAIAAGGPGAVFWMWVMAFFGASTAYVESTLAQIYKEKDEQGRYRGGPAYFIEKGLGKKWFAWLFAVAMTLSCGFLLPGVQANEIANGLGNAWAVPGWAVAAGVVLLLGFIIFGGVKRIAHFAEVAVPFMAAAYVLIAILILIVHADRVPGMFALIFQSAFGQDAVFGGLAGAAIMWGVKRGIYSNEAGQGTGPHAAAAAEVSHPAKQGFVQAFSIYFDTFLICTATSVMILATGKYNVRTPDGQNWLVQHIPGIESGTGYAQAAVETLMPGFGAGFIAIALFFFAFTTIMAYYYIAETNVAYINRAVHRPWLILLLRFTVLAAVVIGIYRSGGATWKLGDIGVGLTTWLNIIAILILQKPAMLALKDYERQKKAGKDPAFDPDAAGIKHADIWRQ
ncbi:MAG: alanine:cation symporter family protein [Xanthomonadaceae bacterium]|nr:alanine:cation symporter family protein [Xanthomonadaceae bacterium]